MLGEVPTPYNSPNHSYPSREPPPLARRGTSGPQSPKRFRGHERTINRPYSYHNVRVSELITTAKPSHSFRRSRDHNAVQAALNCGGAIRAGMSITTQYKKTSGADRYFPHRMLLCFFDMQKENIRLADASATPRSRSDVIFLCFRLVRLA